MKKILVLLTGLILCVGLFANITPYGSARLGWTLFENYEAMGEDGQAFILSDFRLQSNSRFGINFENGDLTANVEVNAGFEDNETVGLNLRHLWAEKSFGKWSLLVGITEDRANFVPNQIWANDLGLIGYGAVDSGTNPMVRLNTREGFYAAFMAPTFTDDVTEDCVSFFMPKINLGWDVNFNNYPIRLYPSLTFQMLIPDEDLGNDRDSHMALLLNTTAEFDLTPEMTLTANFNFGLNAADMGYDGVAVGAEWDPVEEEWVSTTTIGIWMNFLYRFNAFDLNAGFGMMMHSGDDFDDSVTDMGFFLNCAFRLNDSLFLIPEFGMFMPEGDDNNEMYLGLQLRFDF